jgi:hypothetical protein
MKIFAMGMWCLMCVSMLWMITSFPLSLTLVNVKDVQVGL